MSDSTEPAEEQPPPSTAKRRSAHSRGASERLDQRKLSRWAAPAAVLIAVVALAVAVWALLRSPSDTASPTSEQIADAKGRACVAYTTVRTAVALQTHVEPGTDPVAAQAQAANARLAMSVGGDYLLGHLDPAVPPQLAEVMRSFAADLQDLTINALTGVGEIDPAQVARLHDVEAKSAKIVELCK